MQLHLHAEPKPCVGTHGFRRLSAACVRSLLGAPRGASEHELQTQLVDSPRPGGCHDVRNVADVRLVETPLNWVWLKALNDSNRNWTRVPLAELEVLEQRQIQVVDPGPAQSVPPDVPEAARLPAARTPRC